MIHKIEIESGKRIELINITDQVNSLIKESKVTEGICYLHVPHTTAALTINENADPDVAYDILEKTSSLIPPDDDYSHLEGNSDAHIKSSLIGASLNLIIDKGRLLFGRWQCLYFCEFDGPRNRNVYIKIIKC